MSDFFQDVFLTKSWIIHPHSLLLPLGSPPPSQADVPLPDAAGQLWADGHRWQPTGLQASWDLCGKDVQDGGLGDPADLHEDRRGGWVLVWCRRESIDTQTHTHTWILRVLMRVHEPEREGFAPHYESTLCSLLHAQYYKHKQSNSFFAKFSVFPSGDKCNLQVK